MAEISRPATFGKLNALAYKAIEGATVFCKLRGNPSVELQHWLAQILQTQDSDMHRIIKHCGLDASIVAAELQQSLDRLPRGASQVTDLSSNVDSAAERGWMYASLMFGDDRVRTGYLLIGMLKTSSLRTALMSISKQFERVRLDELTDNFRCSDGRLARRPPAGQRKRRHSGRGERRHRAGGDGQAGSAQSAFAIDLTERARKGELDPVAGRDEEIRQIVDILMRRRQNNPILTGEAGVGNRPPWSRGSPSAWREGDVPPPLQKVSPSTRSTWAYCRPARASRENSRNRLKPASIEEMQGVGHPDHPVHRRGPHHDRRGGRRPAQNDAANLLKPALAAGRAAHDRRHHLGRVQEVFRERTPPLARRFQVDEGRAETETRRKAVIKMMRGDHVGMLEKHHGVRNCWTRPIEASREALRTATSPARQLPDKSVSLLDTACARVAIEPGTPSPPELVDVQRRIEALTIERDIIEREANVSIDVDTRRDRDRADQARGRAFREKDLPALASDEEKKLADRMLEIRAWLSSELQGSRR